MAEPSPHDVACVPDVRSAVGILLVALLAGCGGQGDAAPSGDGVPSTAAPSPSAATPSEVAAPSRLVIGSLDLDEELIDVGIAASGELEVPEDPARVGWFSGGGRPGGSGPTVIVGHLDSRTGPAVFSRLPELRPGDVVSVTSRSGSTVEYRVSEVRDFSQSEGAFPTEAVFGATATDTLRLVTCTGPYDQRAGRYTENRVVFAEPTA